ncbi:NAD(P)/FAD-dependent oxidoreductase [Conexibacter sp. SYSU D00693]|uniref:NAD(P)/FAD-dependent oxidoreductase n=1 Tax=Conexibacter sp. SYSU D00693 TaxID=2812560 RepID=UPI001F11F016|nr:FAD-dependent monooxygenase [Conexibacter sp. SYSU D00693]
MAAPTARRAVPETVDVVVAGARCAGSAAAIALARAGRRVVVVDRAHFPSDTLSTHVNFPSAVAEIDKLGALDRVLACDPPRAHHGMVEAAGVRCLERFATVDGIDFGICVPRPHFDHALVQTAREAGAEVRERTSLEEVLWRDGRVAGVVVRDAEGERREIRCKLLVGADGRRSTVARLVGAARPYRGSRNGRGCAFFTMDDPQLGTAWRDRLVQFRAEETHALVFPCPDDRVLCLFMGPAADVARFRKDPDGMWERMLDELPAVRERLGGATNRSKLRSTADTVAFFRRSSGPGWALAGDAGHFKDPIIGQGMRDAMRFGRLLGEGVAPVLDDARALDAAAVAVEARRDRECLPTYHWGNRESRVFSVSPLVQEVLRGWDGADPPRLLEMFDRVTEPHRALNPLVGARAMARAALRPGVDRRALAAEVLEELRLDLDVWREQRRGGFRVAKPTRDERRDWVWPPAERSAPRPQPAAADEAAPAEVVAA